MDWSPLYPVPTTKDSRYYHQVKNVIILAEIHTCKKLDHNVISWIMHIGISKPHLGLQQLDRTILKALIIEVF